MPDDAIRDVIRGDASMHFKEHRMRIVILLTTLFRAMTKLVKNSQISSSEDLQRQLDSKGDDARTVREVLYNKVANKASVRCY